MCSNGLSWEWVAGERVEEGFDVVGIDHRGPVLGVDRSRLPLLSRMVKECLSRTTVWPWSHSWGNPASPTVRSSKMWASRSPTFGIGRIPDFEDTNVEPSG